MQHTRTQVTTTVGSLRAASGLIHILGLRLQTTTGLPAYGIMPTNTGLLVMTAFNRPDTDQRVLELSDTMWVTADIDTHPKAFPHRIRTIMANAGNKRHGVAADA